MSIDSPARSRPARSPFLLRWLALTEQHGSQTAALEALVRIHDEHDRLRRAVRALGLSPEILASEAHAASLAEAAAAEPS